MRILVVEDNQDMADFLRTGLCAECFAVDVANDGEKGEFMAITNEYDLIILDNMLPKKNGEEVCRAIRNKNNEVPIIITSVKSDVVSKVALLEMGADDYVVKPFSFEELLARIRAILRRPSGIKEEVLKAGDLVLNIRKHEVTRGGKDVHLTRKEFMLLELLLKNRGEVVSRGVIWEHVWDINADPFSNTIESHIRSIRKKLCMKGKRNIIKTISGRGYKITEE